MPKSIMSLPEFRERAHQLVCRHCDHVGLVESPRSGGGGIRPVCPACLDLTPLNGVSWLPQNDLKTRRPNLGSTATADVWEANGDRCAFCGKSRALCERLGLGLTIQHVLPVVYGGAEGPLIPFCARCQQASVAALAETQRIEEHVGTLQATIDRIERKFPHLIDDTAA